MLLLALVGRASAQGHGRDGHGFGDHRPSPRDTVTRTLGGPWQVWTHAGIGWLAAPADVRRRYTGGLDVGASGDRRFADRVALRARVDFDDLPSSRPDAVLIRGVAYRTNSNYGHGWIGTTLAAGAVRPWNHLWLEGGAGGGYFRNGLGVNDYVDLQTGRTVPVVGRSGWGPTWSAGARYEFQPGRHDRMLGEFRFTSMDRDGTRLSFWSLRFGWRAL